MWIFGRNKKISDVLASHSSSAPIGPQDNNGIHYYK